MAVEYIAGVQNTGIIFTDEKKVEVPEKLAWLRPSATPFLHLTGGMGKAGPKIKHDTVGNMEFQVFEKKPHAEHISVNYVAGYGTGDVTFVVDDASHVSPGWVLEHLPSGEHLLVTSRNISTPSITCTRSVGPTAAATIANNDVFLKVGTAHEEFGGYPTIVMVKNSKRTNYCQFFRKPYGLSDIAKHTVMYTGPKEPELSQEAMISMKLDIEKALLLGEPFYDSTGGPDGTPIWTTGGALYWIKNGGGQVTLATPSYTRVQFNRFVSSLFEEGEDTKILLAGSNIIDAIEYYKDQKLEFRQSEEFTNLRMAEWENSSGRLMIARDRILRNSPVGDTTQGHAGTGIALDMSCWKQNQFSSLGLALYPDIVKDGKSGKIHEYRYVGGLGVESPEKSGAILDFTTFN